MRISSIPLRVQNTASSSITFIMLPKMLSVEDPMLYTQKSKSGLLSVDIDMNNMIMIHSIHLIILTFSFIFSPSFFPPPEGFVFSDNIGGDLPVGSSTGGDLCSTPCGGSFDLSGLASFGTLPFGIDLSP